MSWKLKDSPRRLWRRPARGAILAALILFAMALAGGNGPALAQTAAAAPGGAGASAAAPAGAPADPQSAARNAEVNVLQKRSILLQRAIVQENARLQQLELQLRVLAHQIQTVKQGAPGAGGTQGSTAQAASAAQSGGAAQSGSSAHSGSTAQVAASGGQAQQAGGAPPQGTAAAESVQPSAESRKSPAAPSSLEAVYQQQNALFRKGFTLYPQFSYAYTNHNALNLNGFLALGAIFLGNVNVSSIDSDVFTYNLEMFYGITPHFELDLNVPYLYEHASYTEIGANNSSQQTSQVGVSNSNLGDINGGFYWQVLSQHDWWPNLIWNAQVSAPTGISPFGIKIHQGTPQNDNLDYPATLPTGKGVWGLSSGFTLIRQIDPVVLFGSGNWYYEFTQHVGDVSTEFGQKVPGEVAPGNALSYTLGAAIALNERLSTTLEFQDIISNATEIRPQGQAWQKIYGSDGQAAQLILGATYVANAHFYPFLQVGIGASEYAPNMQVMLWMPYYF